MPKDRTPDYFGITPTVDFHIQFCYDCEHSDANGDCCHAQQKDCWVYKLKMQFQNDNLSKVPPALMAGPEDTRNFHTIYACADGDGSNLPPAGGEKPDPDWYDVPPNAHPEQQSLATIAATLGSNGNAHVYLREITGDVIAGYPDGVMANRFVPKSEYSTWRIEFVLVAVRDRIHYYEVPIRDIVYIILNQFGHLDIYLKPDHKPLSLLRGPGVTLIADRKG